jgi:OmcA/MtrC family decaheme c-type cytochrome
MAGLLLVSLLLAGCDGDDGAPGLAGPQGPPGVPAPADIGTAESVTATIDEVTIASPPLMRFRLADAAGNAVTGLPAGAISFTIAKLVPGTDGNASYWQSYRNGIEVANGIGPGAEDQVQAETENGTEGTLVDNGDGSYAYTYATDLTQVDDVPFQPELTHRAGFEIRGFVAIDNPTYTWQPSTGSTDNVFTREIVADETCNRCHDKLAVHGDARFQNRYCMTCHNPESADAQSGNTVDMTVMTHKIHYGADLPSVKAGGEYAIWGFRDIKHDYSNVVYPQDVRNCRSCHDENDPATPDAANWFRMPTVEACGACHDDVDFATGQNHGAGISAGNGECTICHSPGKPLGVEEAHVIPEQVAAAAFKFNLLDVADTAPGELPAVTVSVTDPTNGDNPYDVLNDPAFSGSARLVVNVAWNNLEISNTGSGSGADSGAPAQPLQLNVLADGLDNADGTFTVTAAAPIPADVTGSGIAALEGRTRVDGLTVAVPGEAQSYAITDGVATDRREVVELSRCNDCHQSLSLHGSNRTDNIELCVTCHNPNATDIAARVRGGADSSNSPDGKDEESIELKTMIHAIHAGIGRENGFFVYGFFGTPHDYSEVVYPGKLTNCEGCHKPGTYYPVGAFALAVSTDTGADPDDPFDDINTAPNAAACWGCHDRDAAVAHMEANGGAFDVMQTPDGTLVSISQGTVIETCDVCHGPGRSADVKVLHGIE